MWPFRKKEERVSTLEALLLSAGLLPDEISSTQAVNIPSMAGCLEAICNTVAMLPILLYQEVNGKVTVISDNRTKLLNDDTKDTLDGFQFKKALTEDYLLNGVGYAYINRNRNKTKSLHYTDYNRITINSGVDPIFKSYEILCGGATYKPFEFIKITRKTKDGVTGKGIISENKEILAVVYNSLVYENMLVKTGGNKKGFLKAQSKLEKPAMDELKLAWNNLYKNNTENVVVLNKGLDFQEASNTSIEMQLNENKKTNSIEICKLFNMPPSILEGKATEEEYNNYIKICILPILKAITTALNKDLLLESEKGSFYFAVDTKELLKGDLLKRFQAYEIAIKNGFMQWDEVRYIEDLAPYGLDFIKMGLQDVLYNIKTKEIYTPNTDKTAKIDNKNKPLEGGENK